MKSMLKFVLEGIQESFKLAAAIVLAVVTVLSAFAHHSLKEPTCERSPQSDSSC